MKCPHCGTAIHEGFSREELGTDKEGYWILLRQDCPECHKMIVKLGLYEIIESHKHPASGIMGTASPGPLSMVTSDTLKSYYVRPQYPTRPVPDEIPEQYRREFGESVAVLPISPKASTALSRRCLQNLLENHVGVKPGRLSDEIQEVIDSGDLSSDLESEIDGIRTVGNFAAHPIKDTDSGVVVDVEEGEAEWNLDVLEDLFDHYFVKGAKRKQRIDAANKKLKEAGKPPLKGSTS